MITPVDVENRESQSGRGTRFKVRLPFGKLLAILAVFLFLIVYFAPRIFVSIGPGEVGVVYLRFFGGTQTDEVLSEGMRMVAPWDKVYIYSIREQETKHDLEVLTKEGLAVKLHLSIRFHPEPDMVGMLHERIGPDYKNRVVIPEVESALRLIMGQFLMQQVYGSERGLVQKIINESLEHVSQKFVKIDEIVLRNVELPKKIQDSIEQKMTEKELAEAYEFKLARAKQEAERKEIEANGFKRYNDILNSSITPGILRWRGIEASKELAGSPNSKIIFVGPKANDLPVMLGSDK